MLKSPEGRDAVRRLVREIKARAVGVRMMDLTVCGAIDPYRPLLGGKLVSCLLASPEVRNEYAERYSGAPSVIASSLAGREVKREATLVFLGTTSLYGAGSSQYNRIKVPGEAVGSEYRTALEYARIGVTEGFGTLHFGAATLEALNDALAAHGDYARVNSSFGEGASPRLRKIRDGLTQIGYPANSLLKHGNPRIIYGIKLAANVAEVLLGLEEEAAYLVPDDDDASEMITAYWRERWLAKRILRPGIIEAVAEHTLDYPIDHGARVVLPHGQTDQLQLNLLGGQP